MEANLGYKIPDKYCRVILVRQDSFIASVVRFFTQSKFNHIAITDACADDDEEYDVVISLDPFTSVSRYIRPVNWGTCVRTRYRYRTTLPLHSLQKVINLRYSFWHSIKTGLFHNFPILRKYLSTAVSRSLRPNQI